MNETFINDMLEVIKEADVNEILSNNKNLRERYLNYIAKKEQIFFEKTIEKSGYETVKILHQQNYFLNNEEEIKKKELEVINKYFIYGNLKTAKVDDLEKLNQTNTIMTSIKEKDFETEIINDERSREEIINIIKMYDQEFYEAYIKLNQEEVEKVEYDLKMIRTYDQYLKAKEEGR
ncbi:MAG: hypothetical protein ACK5HR_02940 [Mycoplasmatales bacterium]